ncbi:hypothetical protein BGZ46_010317 [Entomortierella lignicola]|nr:hypothetical protein BGZ46_010317 [Entomortierella lignicola]
MPDAGIHTQENPTSFTTTDASGYPDKHDGLVAHSPPTVIQDPHEHHKHNQVQDNPESKDGHTLHDIFHNPSNIPFYDMIHRHKDEKHKDEKHKDHGHGEKPILGHTAGGHLHNHKSPIGDTPVEIAEQLQDPTTCPPETLRLYTVPNYLK